MKILFYLYSICCILIIASCNTRQKYNEALLNAHSEGELLEDFDIMRKTLEEAHPGLNWYISEESLNFKFDSVKALLNKPMKSIEFYNVVAPLISEIKCGHTRMIYPGLKYSREEKNIIREKGIHPFSQFQTYVEDNKIYIKSVKNDLNSPINKGMEIMSIDNHPAKEILAKEKVLFSSDGYNKTFYDHILSKYLGVYYNLIYQKKDSIFLILKDTTGLCGTWLKYAKNQPKEKKKTSIIDRFRGLDENGNPILNLEIDTLQSTAILKVGSFAFERSNFNKFFKRSFKTLKEENITHLILDLRNNGGGNLLACNKLFRYLYNKPHVFSGRASMKTNHISTAKYFDKFIINPYKFPFFIVNSDENGFYEELPTEKSLKPKKYVYDKDLFILINGHSFSATSLLSANLQAVERGIFIGEESGGGFNKCTAGSVPILNLPHTKIKLRVPLKVIRPYAYRKLQGRGIFPDYEVKNTFSDYLEGKDPEIEKAKQLISSNLLDI